VLAGLLRLQRRLEEAEQIEHSRLRPESLQPRI
jgi:hypothetical protein